MGYKPLRPCRYPGCSTLVPSGYCDAHQPERRDYTREYHDWYSKRIWTRRLRPAQLLREPFCRECAKRGIRTRATDVDHIDPFNGDWKKFTDPENLQSLCHACHSRKTARESLQKKRG